MILDSANSKIEINGGSNSSSFSIALNGKAFKVLSSTLYANKIGSIVRELSTNALDSHIAAGKSDTAFEIHLPDAFEPWFAVKDFGTGMSPEEINSVFTSYFTSTKAESNDYTGMLGLGSKTPFSYTDQFTVTSVKHKIKSIYTAYTDDNGIPNIRLFYSSESDELNGVEIKMSVKREDYQKFQAEVKQQLQYFKVKPQVENCSGFTWITKVEPVIETKNVSIYPSGIGNITAIQGSVGYPLDKIQVNTTKEYTELFNALQQHHADIYFNIGDIGVTASREGIEYTQQTLKNIHAKLDVIKQEMKAYVEDKLKQCKTEWERLCYINSSDLLIGLVDVQQSRNIKKYYGTYSYVLGESTGTQNLYAKRISVHNGKIQRYSNGIYLTATKDTCIVLKDKSHLASRRLLKLIETAAKNKNIIEIERTVSTSYDDAFIEELSKALGDCDSIIKLSSIELPVTEKKATATRTASKPPVYCEYNDNLDIAQWTKRYNALENTACVYVVVERLSPVDYSDSLAISKYKCLKSIITNVPRLIGVTATKASKLGVLAINLKDYISEKQKELLTPELERDIKYLNFNQAMAAKTSYKINTLHPELENLAKGTDVYKFVSAVVNCYNSYYNSSTASKTRAIAEFVGLDNNKYQPTQQVLNRASNIKQKLLKKYPLLGVYERAYHDTITAKHTAEYCKAMHDYYKQKQA